MPIEVIGRFRRRGGVYLAGENVECEIIITNIPNDNENGHGENSTISPNTELIQWCSAQIHCQEIINTHRVNLIKKPSHQLSQGDVASGSTSFLATRVFYTQVLPSEDIPPSYKGLSVKYFYKLTIGVQHADSPVKLLRIPLRVLTLPGLFEMCTRGTNISSSNASLNVDHHRPTTIDIANDLIETITAGKTQHTYNITNEHGKVCTLILQKKAFKLGEDIVGTFDFSQAASVCSQFLISLQTEEKTTEEYLVSKDPRPLVTTHATQHGFCLYYCNCELRVQIPLYATPSFANELVNVQWNLHFEFVISDHIRGSHVRHPDGGVEWTAPSEMDIHTMVWDLPIKVYACNPLHASVTAENWSVNSCSIRI